MKTADATPLDVRTLSDRAAIVDVTVRYARALDRRDWALLRKCFTEDATIEHEGMPGGDTYVVAGAYHDRLRRERDGWRIAHRRLTVSWTAGNSEVLT